MLRLWVRTISVIRIVLGLNSGKYHFRDINAVANFKPGTDAVCIFNDVKTDRPHYRREHVTLIELRAVFGASMQPFTSEQRKWNGKAGDLSSKGKRKYKFTGREVAKRELHPRMFDEDGNFKGSIFVNSIKPEVNYFLYPFDADARTILG